MRPSRWMALIGILVAVGCLKVAQRNAILLKGYALGTQVSGIHEKEVEVAWLKSEIIGLVSPAHLSDVARERQLKLVAWSTLPVAPLLISDAVPSQVQQMRAERGQAQSIAPPTLTARDPTLPTGAADPSD